MSLGRILVVEDDESLRRVTQVQLEKCGYETVVAADVPEALELLETLPEADRVMYRLQWAWKALSAAS